MGANWRKEISVKTISLFLGVLVIAVTGLGQAQGQVPFTNNLVAYYPFDGNANDASGNGNNGQIVGNVVPSTDRFGNPTGAYALDGVSSSAIEVTNTLFNTGQAGYTVSGWFACSNLNLPKNQVVIQTMPQAGMGLGFGPSIPVGALSLGLGTTSEWTQTGIYGNPLCSNQVWYQFVLTKSGTTYTLYLDGQVSAQQTVSTASNFDANVGCIIGSITPINPPYQETFEGRLDDFRIYNRALASNEVQELYSYESASGGPSLYITAQPQSQSVAVGQTATFSVAAGGTSPFGYQWSFDGTTIAGATNAVLTLTNVQMSESGSYSVTVTSLTNAVSSSSAVLTVTAPTQAPFTESLVAYYPFDGNANDASGNGNNGQIVGNVVPSTDRFGNPAGAYAFDGVSSSAIEVTNTLFNIGQPGYTVSGWFACSNLSLATDQDIIQTMPQAGMGLGFIPSLPTGTLDFGVGTTTEWTGGPIYGNPSCSNQIWYQFVLTKSGTTYTLYIDGQVSVQQAVSAASSYNANVGCIIGSITPINPGYHETFGGRLDDFRVYNRALASNEVQELYAYEAQTNGGGTPFYITTQPQSQSVVAGQTATFNVTVSGTPPYGYQWSFDGTNIAGATTATLTLTNVQMSQAGSYSVTVTNATEAVSSFDAVLTVTAPTQAPFTNSLVAYYPFDGNANDASGNGNNGQIVGNVVPSTDRFGNFGGSYAFDGVSSSAIEVTNTLFNIGQPGYTVSGWFACSNLSLTTDQDIIQTMPQAGMGLGFVPSLPPGTLDFGVGTTTEWTGGPIYGNPTCSNQIWYQFVLTKSGTTYTLYIDGQVSVQQTISAASNYNANVGCIIGSITPINPGYHETFGGRLDDFRIYDRALASNEVQELYAYESEPGGPSLYITAQPQGQTVVVGQTATFSVAAGGTPPFGYQWSFDGTNIAGATTATLTLTNVQVSQAGSYSVTVTNATAAVSSSNAVLNLVSPPVITSSPASQSVAVGTPVTFAAAATGTPPLAYQWRFDGTNISGATNTSFSVASAALANVGSYSVVVTSPYGSATSLVATLTVAESTVQIVGGSAVGGGTVVVSVDLIALGSESGFGCSLDFDPALLTYTGVVLGSGASGGVLLSNASEIASGHLGLGIDIFSGTFAPGTNDVFDVSFLVTPVTNLTTTTLSFGMLPTGEEVSDSQANALPAVYLPGTVVIAATGLEGDVSPRPNGDGALNISDWVQEGRFVAGLDTVSNGSEFQRADCAPRGTLGDGQITVADWVQVGRYAVGLDPLTAAGGPASPGPNIRAPGKLDLSDLIELVPLSQGNLTNSVAVQLTAKGNESALSFTVTFDPAMVRFVNATLGSGAVGAALIQNTNKVASGSLGLVVGLVPPATFAKGTQQLVKLNFASVAYSNNAALSFGSSPVFAQLVDSNATVLAANFQNGTLAVGGSTWPILGINQVGNNVVLSWPSSASFLELQASSSLSTGWSNVTTLPSIVGNSLMVTSGLSSNTVFFRLKH